MLIYHDDEASPNCLKTKILLYELDAEFEQVSHDFRRGDLRKEPFFGKFPNAKVPIPSEVDPQRARMVRRGRVTTSLGEQPLLSQ